MSINLSVPEQKLKPRIMVVGVGGAGGNAVNDMIVAKLDGVEFLVVNTDAQALQGSNEPRRVQMGAAITRGLGAGACPEVGCAAAEESLAEIMEHLDDSDMAFIAAGMGGGTGTGAAPVIAKAARERGILTVGVITKPFHFEGVHRMRLAEKGIEELEGFVDTLIVIPNQNLFRIANEKTTFADAFRLADEVLYSGVRGVTDLMIIPGMINLDFADIRSVMGEMGKAMMGTGEAEGERRALEAAEAAIANPLLDDTSMKGAKRVLINVTGGSDMTLFEVDEAANRIRSEVDEEAYIIFGSAFDSELDGKIRVSVVATGIDSEASKRAAPAVLTLPTMRSMPEAETATESESSPDKSTRPGIGNKPLIPFRFTENASGETEAPVEESAPADDTEPRVETEPAADMVEEAEASEKELVEAAVEVDDVAPVADTDFDTDAVAETGVDEPAEPDIQESELPAVAAVSTTGNEMPPVGMPSMDTKDAFIPPAPMTAAGGEQEKPSKPFALADMLNGSSKKPVAVAEELRVGSLFRRIMGADKAKIAKSTGPIAQPLDWQDKSKAPVKPAATMAPATPSAKTAEPTTTSTILPLTPIMETPVATPQTRLGGLEQAERIPAANHEEDLLNIPAFLRRQAN